ncbi:MAG: ImmA/IrrE family metallo-endopeptidase [Alcanivorax sp.]|nr:ImmA/IrrE family metallo-endopeptidase [Alcanivorax sp.]
MATTYAKINPDILSWARERAQLSVSVLARKLGVNEKSVEAWERGDKRLTFRQAQQYAAKTHVPFGYLYLKCPPKEQLPLPDLRTVGGQRPQRPSAELIEMVQIVLRRQEWYAEYLRDQGAERNELVGRFTIQSGVHVVVQHMREALRVPAHPTRGTWEDYFRLLVQRIEEVGILVMREGFIGHYTRPLSVQEFRGFAIADPLAPVIFINQADAPKARFFTLIHELAHIWIGRTGISDASPRTERQEEVFCNATAAEFLVPGKEFEDQWRDLENWRDNLPELEAHFRVSTWVLARRALTLQKISADEYQRYIRELQEEHRNRERENIPMSYYQGRKGHVSQTFSKALLSEALSGRVLLRDAGRLLGMKPSNLAKYAKELGV